MYTEYRKCLANVARLFTRTPNEPGEKSIRRVSVNRRARLFIAIDDNGRERSKTKQNSARGHRASYDIVRGFFRSDVKDENTTFYTVDGRVRSLIIKLRS